MFSHLDLAKMLKAKKAQKAKSKKATPEARREKPAPKANQEKPVTKEREVAQQIETPTKIQNKTEKKESTLSERVPTAARSKTTKKKTTLRDLVKKKANEMAHKEEAKKSKSSSKKPKEEIVSPPTSPSAPEKTPAEHRAASRESGRKRAEEFLGREFQGMTPRERQTYEESHNRDLDRELQSQERKLLANQSRKGIRGGVAFAQRSELDRNAADLRREAHRDLDKLDYETKLKNKASTFAIEEGEAGQDFLDRQIAEDKKRAEEEMKRLTKYDQQIARNLNRI